MGRGSTGKGKGKVKLSTTPSDAKNEIKPFPLRKQRGLTQQLDFEIGRLKDLGANFKEAKDALDLTNLLKDGLKAAEESMELIDNFKAQERKRNLKNINRMYIDGVTRTKAKATRDYVKEFAKKNPGFTIKTPKGTKVSQREFYQAALHLSVYGAKSEKYREFISKVGAKPKGKGRGKKKK